MTPRIAHLGVGAFARAHLSVYADDLLDAGWPAMIRGVSLRNRRAEEQLALQDGLFSVAEREPGADTPLRVIGAIGAMTTGCTAAVEAVAAPSTTVVTLTVTEKGYELDPNDLVDPKRPRSAPAVVALGLARRRDAGLQPPVVVSLDNVVSNGTVLRDRVTKVAERLDPTLPRWITDNVQFPNSVVDRMVPVATSDDLDDVSQRLGLLDLAAVTCERHRSWVITAADGLPPLADVGVQVTEDITPYERRKLWLLNGPHSAFAYGGLLAGCETIAAATEHGDVSSFVRQLVEDILEVADLPLALEASTFAAGAVRRFGNPRLRDTCLRVAADGSRKLPQRLFPVVTARQRQGCQTWRFAIVVATWIAALAGISVQGSPLPAVEDPAADALRSAAMNNDSRELCRRAIGTNADARFVEEVDAVLTRLRREGIGLLVESS